MRYRHQFRIGHSPAAGAGPATGALLAGVIDFHSRSASMAAITPPPILVRIHEAPPVLSDGDRMRFTLWLGPIPLRWTAQIETLSPTSFIDRQVSGPFAVWEHRHTFSTLQDGVVLVEDDVTARLKPHPFWWLAGASMWLGMPVLFAYRAWKTRRLIARQLKTNGSSPESAPLERPSA